MSINLDWETRSDVDLIKEGAYRYVESPWTDALMASYRAVFDERNAAALRAFAAAGGEYQRMYRWRIGQPCPAPLRAYVEAGGEIKAFNAAFERLIWWHVMSARHGWPKPALEQFRCTAVTAAAMALPRSLDRLGAALDLSTKKDKKGSALIKFFSIPVRFESGRPIFNEPDAHPEKFAEFQDYCDTDVLTETEADARLLPLSDEEQAVYHLNERINDRGLRIDVVSARAALEIAAKAKARINREMTEITGGAVTAFTQLPALKEWLGKRGVELPTLDKDDVEEILHEVDDLPPDVRRALELRQEGAKPSVDKIKAMLGRVSKDGRARGVYLHHGAGQTGRFSSRGVQAHNMPKYRKEFEKAVLDGDVVLSTLFETIRSGEPEMLELVYGPSLGRPLHILSDAVRSFIMAAPGHDLVDVDYTSIEGVLAAVIAGENWKIDAYRALLRGEGFGMYELAAAGIYGVPPQEVTKAQRPTGKVAELSCQYQTGVGGIRKFARQNKVKLGGLYRELWRVADEEQHAYVERRFEERVKAHDPNADALGREGWIAAELIKLGWRAKNPAIVAAWKALEEAAERAVVAPGSKHSALGVTYLVAHGFLLCRLPSTRVLAYGKPEIRDVEAPWADKTLPPKDREKKKGVTALGLGQNERWTRFSVYGGSLFNNVVQGSARDILTNGMKNAEAAGYPIVGHTHDEMFAEVPRGWGSVEELARVANQLPGWCAGIPLNASGFRAKRYRKD